MPWLSVRGIWLAAAALLHELLSGRERAQGHDVAQFIARLLDRGLCDKSRVLKANVVQQPLERRRPDGSFADMLVAVQL